MSEKKQATIIYLKKEKQIVEYTHKCNSPPLHFLSFSAVKVHESCEHTRYMLLRIAHILLVTNSLFSKYGIFQKPSKFISLIPTLVPLSRPHSV